VTDPWDDAKPGSPWDRVRQGLEYWSYLRGVTDRQHGRTYNPAYGGATSKDQQLYADGWFDHGMGRNRSEALRRWPDFMEGSE
jgi:hypothetical protein